MDASCGGSGASATVQKTLTAAAQTASMTGLPTADTVQAPATGGNAAAHWLTRERVVVYARIFIVIYLLSAAAWVVLSTDLIDAKGKPLGYDFITFWAGSFLALAGEAAQSFDMARIFAVEQLAVPANQSVFLWHYPPTFHLVVLPLALMPYLVAYAVWTIGSFAIYAAVIRRFLPRPETVWVLAAFPGAFINAFHGQNGFLTAVLFGAALLQLKTRPIAAGILFGLMSWKPQLGLLLPVALLCARQWRAFAAAGATTLAVAALSLLVFGAEPWIAFWHNIPLVGVLLDTGALPWPKIPSLYVALRVLGMAATPAYVLHGIAALGVLAAVAQVWRGAAPLRLRGAVLVVGALLMPPYLFDYDLALLAIPIAILVWDGLQHGWNPYEREVLLAAWLTPLAAPGIAEHLGIPLAFPVLLALFAAAARRALATQKPACN
jgi:hypothetical protein